MKNLLIHILVFLSFLVSTCEQNSENKLTSCFQVDLNDTTHYHIINKWIFLGIIDKQTQVEKCVPVNIREMNIEFNNTNKFNGISSCNYIAGNFSISDPDSIKIDKLGTTDAYCLNDTIREWEEKYCTGLKNATNFVILGNRLKIQTKISFNMIFRAD